MFLMRSPVLFGVLLIALVSRRQAAAQAAPADSSVVTAAVAAVRQYYANGTRAESHLLTGTEYIDYTKSLTTGNQFFRSSTPQPGNILYDGFYFEQVPLLYDIRLDQVVTAAPIGSARMKLLTENIRYFTLEGHRFVRLTPGAGKNGLRAAGFYDLLLEGPVSALAKRSKEEIQVVERQKLGYAYREKDVFFLQKDQAVFEVASLNSILAVLPEKKAELKEYARSSNLRFKDDGGEVSSRETAIVALVRYYNTLVK